MTKRGYSNFDLTVPHKYRKTETVHPPSFWKIIDTFDKNNIDSNNNPRVNYISIIKYRDNRDMRIINNIDNINNEDNTSKVCNKPIEKNKKIQKSDFITLNGISYYIGNQKRYNTWMSKYNALKAFIQIFGSIPSTRLNKRLHMWHKYQCDRYKLGKLETYKIILMNRLEQLINETNDNINKGKRILHFVDTT